MARAVRLCPELTILRPDFAKYARRLASRSSRSSAASRRSSSRSRSTRRTSTSPRTPRARRSASRWRGASSARIREETRLTASAGVAPNKFLAKIASGWKKPDGLTVIAPERVERFLQELPVDALWGVGPVTAGRLRAVGIHRLVDVRTAPAEVLQKAVGSWAESLRRLSFGEDDRPVEPNRERKSIGCEETYAKDLEDLAAIRERGRAARAPHRRRSSSARASSRAP